MNIDQIKKRATYYKIELYSQVRNEQREDKEYIDDIFKVPEVHKPHKAVRHGFGRRMIDAPAEQIITANPQVFVEITKGSQSAESKISKLFNDWVGILRRQNPNPFKEFVKNQLAEGEAFIRLGHEESWVTGDMKQIGLPVWFSVPDSMVVYASPSEDENGIPKEVFVCYERQPWDVLVDWPKWTNPKQVGIGSNEKKKAEWTEYWSSDSRYFAADGESLLSKGIQPNPYNFPPFIRKYSGYGKRSPSGELADLIVSDIKFARGLLYDECVTASDISSSLHLFSHKPVLITAPGKINKKALREEFVLGAYRLVVLDGLPADTKIDIGVTITPSPELLNHYGQILGQIHERCPFLLAGFPMGSSGTQERMTGSESMRRYLTIIENTETAWATAFEKAWEIIKAIPKLRPKGIEQSDLDCEIKCTVRLRAPDPAEENRLSTMGSRLIQNKEIDPITNLTEFKGYTKERAEEVLIDTIAYDVILNDPEIRRLIGMRVAEKSGMLEELTKIRATSKEIEPKAMGQLPSTTRQRIQGEAVTEQGMEAAPEELRELRAPPVPYTRGGGV